MTKQLPIAPWRDTVDEYERVNRLWNLINAMLLAESLRTDRDKQVIDDLLDAKSSVTKILCRYSSWKLAQKQGHLL